ncbi:hypothetical protein QVD17_28154 [Tagetes erecta]|uniref:Uncharacterized protein n=1 Tax=Tagetes erecta TaxID=13708 RepID=A0AAD8NRU1_TARER|nr:hypothetical protein QVD17_28154 [Tagetes erecta]
MESAPAACSCASEAPALKTSINGGTFPDLTIFNLFVFSRERFTSEAPALTVVPPSPLPPHHHPAAACPYVVHKAYVKPVQHVFALVAFPLVQK